MRVARTSNLKRDAERIASMMRRAGMDKVRIVGARCFWTIVARAKVTQLARFASEEAVYESQR